jgi:hypothetical protein
VLSDTLPDMSDFIFPEDVNTYEDEVAKWIPEEAEPNTSR